MNLFIGAVSIMESSGSIITTSSQYDVIIVGAGVSGLYSATLLHLSDPNLKIAVLEASDRYGGRVCPSQDQTISYPIEMGAEWVHGNKSLLFDKLTRRHRGLLREYKDFSCAYYLDNRLLIHPPYWDKDLVHLEKFVDSIYKYRGADISVDQHLNSLGITSTHRTRHLYESWLCGEFGTSLDRIGMRSLALMEDGWEAGESDFVVRGDYLSSIIAAFGMAIAIPLIQYSKEVTEVHYDLAGGVALSCRDGSQLLCARTIITTPLPILKTLSFNPSLPTTHQQALAQLGMDAGMKITIFFSQRFWGDKVCEIALRVPDASGAWDPGYFKWGPRGDKCKDSPHLLSFLFTGTRAEELSRISDEDKVASLLQALDIAYDGAASNNFAQHYLVKDWSREPFIRGAYSYPLPGSYRSGRDNARVVLAKAVGGGRVFFAGEAIAVRHPCTVHGALESSEAAARQLIEEIKKMGRR